MDCINNSGGRSSAYMTETMLKYPEFRAGCFVIFCNTGREHDETLRFLRLCELRWLALYDKHITWLEYDPDCKFKVVDYYTAHRISDTHKKSPFEKLLDRRKYLPNAVQRYCTSKLKIRVAADFMIAQGEKHWASYVGIRFDEPKRWMDKKKPQKQRFHVIHPMVDWGTTKADVNAFWKTMPFDLKLAPHQGNCDLCFLKGKGKKNRIIRDDPGSADWWIKMEQSHKGTFRKEYSYQKLKINIDAAPEFEFRDDYECDTDCYCNID